MITESILGDGESESILGDGESHLLLAMVKKKKRVCIWETPIRFLRK